MSSHENCHLGHAFVVSTCILQQILSRYQLLKVLCSEIYFFLFFKYIFLALPMSSIHKVSHKAVLLGNPAWRLWRVGNGLNTGFPYFQAANNDVINVNYPYTTKSPLLKLLSSVQFYALLRKHWSLLIRNKGNIQMLT